MFFKVGRVKNSITMKNLNSVLRLEITDIAIALINMTHQIPDLMSNLDEPLPTLRSLCN